MPGRTGGKWTKESALRGTQCACGFGRLPFAFTGVPGVDRGVADADIADAFAEEPVLAVRGLRDQRLRPLVGLTRAVDSDAQILCHELHEVGFFLFHVLVFLVVLTEGQRERDSEKQGCRGTGDHV